MRKNRYKPIQTDDEALVVETLRNNIASEAAKVYEEMRILSKNFTIPSNVIFPESKAKIAIVVLRIQAKVRAEFDENSESFRRINAVYKYISNR